MNYIVVMPKETPPRHAMVSDADRLPAIGERVILCDPDEGDPSMYPGVMYEVERLTHFASSQGPDTAPGKRYRTTKVLVHVRRMERSEYGPLAAEADTGS